MFQLESEMRPAVEAWLQSRVQYIQHEAWCLTPICDLLGFSFRAEAVQQRIQMRQRTPLPMHMWGETRPWMPLYEKVVAVEMKLSKMAKVLFQAQMHYREVTESWVAMPEPFASRIVAKCREPGIGVLAVGETCDVLLPARVHDPDSPSWNHHRIAETFWRKHGKAFKGERDEQAD